MTKIRFATEAALATQATANSVAYAPQDGLVPIWNSDYDIGNQTSVVPPWNGVNLPAVGGVDQPSRITTIDPTTLTASGVVPTGRVMRVQILTGELLADGSSSRAEVFGRNTNPWSTPYNKWPDPAGSVRWYGWSTLIPSGFPTDSTATNWLLITQFKGLNGGSPPLSVEIKRSGFRLGGTRTNSGLVPNDGNLGAISFDTWTRFVVGVKWSTDPAVGWLEVWRDGALVIPRMPLATMDTFNGNPDPTYVKQGIYRATTWNASHLLYHGPLKIGTTRASVMDGTTHVSGAQVAAAITQVIVDHGDGTVSFG